MSLHFPDPCKVPVPPAIVVVPLPDTGMNAMSTPFSPNVRLFYLPATHMGTKKVLTMGDEAGVGGGLITGGIKGPGATMTGNPIVFINMMPGENLLNPTTGNNYNAMAGAQIVPSVTNVLFTLCRGEGGAREEAATEGTPSMAELHSVGVGAGLSLIEDRGARLVVRIASFTDDVPRRMFQLLDDRSALEALVIDLRGNRGGSADAALALAGDFLDKGTPLAIFIDRDGDASVHRARTRGRYPGTLTLLVDGDTASAAELFAASLQHHGRARVVGTRTRGKATAQQLVPGHPDGNYATVAELRRPDGTTWQDQGLEPDAAPIGADPAAEAYS